MKTLSFLFCLALAISFTACKNNTKKTTPSKVEQHDSTAISIGDNSQNALDWTGTYTGVLPCADCPGIETTVTLNSDLTYTRVMNYLERDTKSEKQGNFQWVDNGSKVILLNEDGSAAARYKVGENQLIQLGGDGNEIKGALAQSYILKKTEK